jgi:hypothetical protein
MDLPVIDTTPFLNSGQIVGRPQLPGRKASVESITGMAWGILSNAGLNLGQGAASHLVWSDLEVDLG